MWFSTAAKKAARGGRGEARVQGYVKAVLSVQYPTAKIIDHLYVMLSWSAWREFTHSAKFGEQLHVGVW